MKKLVIYQLVLALVVMALLVALRSSRPLQASAARIVGLSSGAGLLKQADAAAQSFQLHAAYERYICPKCRRKVEASDVFAVYSRRQVVRFCGYCFLDILIAIVPQVEEVKPLETHDPATPKPERPDG